MKNKKIYRTLAALCASLVLMGGFSVTAFAQGTEGTDLEDTTNDENVVVEETEESPALTPEGNAALVDDFGGNKQLITVTTKAGNYFYILIDRANEDKETAVHFLNQVDEADLMALMEEGQTTEEQPAVCTCAGKCETGAVDTACPVCVTDWNACAGKEPEPEATEETEVTEEPEKSPGFTPAALLMVLLAMGGIGAVTYLKFIRKNPKPAVGHDPDDYAYDDGEELPDGEEIPDEEELDLEDGEADGLEDMDTGGYEAEESGEKEA